MIYGYSGHGCGNETVNAQQGVSWGMCQQETADAVHTNKSRERDMLRVTRPVGSRRRWRDAFEGQRLRRLGRLRSWPTHDS